MGESEEEKYSDDFEGGEDPESEDFDDEERSSSENSASFGEENSYQHFSRPSAYEFNQILNSNSDCHV